MPSICKFLRNLRRARSVKYITLNKFSKRIVAKIYVAIIKCARAKSIDSESYRNFQSGNEFLFQSRVALIFSLTAAKSSKPSSTTVGVRVREARFSIHRHSTMTLWISLQSPIRKLFGRSGSFLIYTYKYNIKSRNATWSRTYIILWRNWLIMLIFRNVYVFLYNFNFIRGLKFSDNYITIITLVYNSTKCIFKILDI